MIMTSILLRIYVGHVTASIGAQAHAKPPRLQLICPKLDDRDGCHHSHSRHPPRSKTRRPRRVLRASRLKSLNAAKTLCPGQSGVSLYQQPHT
ncbi:hypothetical protein PR003_g22014 [Phytophthora rubi]|uniref:Secreted protein n=1 Tax=Phytophthora rubi TaxID=129364 RepID=A0A6A3JQK1_9STRA|nr:hypothetical protein PR002_g21411 [Phytophthora rubi]KAE8994464.1 hypothetical protein PR001_g20388 [Phytophthora rubi]KAE9303407.1 hypothetical protein PR003_g22014 [Phytophthora rubi]